MDQYNDEKNQKKLAYSKTEVIQLLQWLHKRRKHPMSSLQYYKLTLLLPYPSLKTVESLFGSWTNALVEAELLYTPPTRRK